ncbi:acyltransferase family protein [Streptomyces sp. NBC_01198]|uniref:acyltransferase family protein n=1 Tax=Streptomyces sp. NBC_01198 TaxID=2903769 RepID=UPI002E153901|nr:acyltransferase [Streptomyces sp. NBC_01198]
MRHPTKRRLYVLDGLRLVAALMVVAYHYLGYNRSYPWGRDNQEIFPLPHRFAVYGWLGVYLFFLISGFMICMSCWGRTPRQFAVSRFIRLYPAYWVALIATSTMLWLSPDVSNPRLTDVLTNATMIQQGLGTPNIDGVYWSLWAELRFYLIFAVVAVMGATYRRVVSFCVIWLVAALVAEHADNDLLTVLADPVYAPFFIGGVAMYLLYRFGHRTGPWLLIAASWLDGLHQMSGLAAGASNVAKTHVYWSISVGVMTVFYVLVTAVALGRLKAFNWQWLTVAGSITYPLYLIHEDLGWEVIRYSHDLMPPYVLLVGLVAVMLLAAYLVNRLIEQPAARRLKQWLSPPRAAAVRPPA